MPITQQVDHLLGGVSQAPPHLRDPSQGGEQINMLSHRTRGLRRRPASEHKALLSSSLTGIDALFTAELYRSSTERYRAVILNGDLHVYDAFTGAAQTVYFPNGKGYLSAVTRGFRHVLTGDRMVLLNRSVAVTRDAASATPAAVPQALLVVKAVRVSGKYTLHIDGAVRTVVAAQDSADNLAAQLASSFPAGYTVRTSGSIVHVQKPDNSDFTISLDDGANGTSVLVVKDTVQAFDLLPTRALGNPIVQIVGDPDSTLDDYYVQYDEAHNVWKECLKPGLFARLAASTMPHVLAYNGNILDATTNQTPTVLPVITDALAADTTPQAFTNINGAGADDSDHDVTEEGDYLGATLAGTDGTFRTITLRYDLDTTNVTDDITVTVTAYINTGPLTSFSAVTSKSYVAGMVYANETIVLTGSPVAGTDIKLMLNYSTGSTPGTGQADLKGHGAANPLGPGVTAEKELAKQIAFDPFRYYPGGALYTLTVNGTPYTYTVGMYASGADETGAQIASQLLLAMAPGAPPGGGWPATMGFAHAGPTPGLIEITETDGITPTVSVTCSFDTTKQFYNAALSLPTSALVGQTLKNLTTSATGTITANSARVITVPSFSGGTRNTLADGDVCVVVGTGTYFVFRENAWTPRAAGDDASVPFPSFVDRTLDEVFFYQNRLGVTSRDSIVLSAENDNANFFRQSAAQLLADDVIDVRVSSRLVAQFIGAVAWTDGLYLSSDDEWFRLSGLPVLTPSSVRIDPMGSYLSAPNVRALVVSGRLFFPAVKNGFARVSVAEQATSAVGETTLEPHDITLHIPAYMPGNPMGFTADSQAEMLFLLTDALNDVGGRDLFVCNYHFSPNDAAQIAWHRWRFETGELIAIDAVNGVLTLLVVRPGGLYLETITLDPPEYAPALLGDGTGTGYGQYNGSGLIP